MQTPHYARYLGALFFFSLGISQAQAAPAELQAITIHFNATSRSADLHTERFASILKNINYNFTIVSKNKNDHQNEINKKLSSLCADVSLKTSMAKYYPNKPYTVVISSLLVLNRSYFKNCSTTGLQFPANPNGSTIF